MKERTFLIILLIVVFIINAGVVYGVFYWNPIYSFLKLSPSSSGSNAWSSDDQALAFFVENKEMVTLRCYDFASSSFRDYPLPGEEFKYSNRDGISYSPDKSKLAIVGQRDSSRYLYIMDLQSGILTGLSVVLENSDLAQLDSGSPVPPPIWIDNEIIVYENTVPWKRNGVVFIDLKNRTENRFIESATRPTLSSDHAKLAYAIRDSGEVFHVEIVSLASRDTKTVTRNIQGYPSFLSWSPNGNIIALEYSVPESGTSSHNQVAFIEEGKEMVYLSRERYLSRPQWIDNRGIFIAEAEAKSFLGNWSYSFTGLYYYNIDTEEYKKITTKIRSASFSISPEKKWLISSMGSRGLFLLDVNRVIHPLFIDRLRDWLGIVSM